MIVWITASYISLKLKLISLTDKDVDVFIVTTKPKYI